MGDAIISCIIVNNHLKVLSNQFTLTVPREDRCHMIFAYLRITAPTLRDKDHARFSLYKSPSPDTIFPDQLDELNKKHDRVDLELEVPVSPSARVKDAFPSDQARSSRERIPIDAIIFLDDDMQGTFSTY